MFNCVFFFLLKFVVVVFLPRDTFAICAFHSSDAIQVVPCWRRLPFTGTLCHVINFNLSLFFSVHLTVYLQGPPAACHPPAGDPEPGSLQPHHSVDYQQPAAVSASQ